MGITGIILILLAIVSYADSTLSQITSDGIETGYVPPLTGGSVLFDQAYTGIIDAAIRSDGMCLSADEFILTEASRLESIEWWGVFLTEPCAGFHLRIYSNDCDNRTVPGAPGDLLWEIPAASVVNTDTGDDFYGYDIYHTEIVLDSSNYFEADAGKVYWLSPYYSEVDFYWGDLQESGIMCFSINGGNWSRYDFHCFFRLNGTPGLALEATTWAAIKRGF